MRYKNLTGGTLMALGLMGCPTTSTGTSNVCGDETRSQTYVEGVAAVSDSDYIVQLMSADPAPPNVNENLWTLHITDVNDADAMGCTATLIPFMPDHGHGSSATPGWTEHTDQDGYYDTDLLFIMPGYWEVPVSLDCGGDLSEHIFGFCAEG